MKTSEFKKHIQDLKLEFKETDDFILIEPIIKIFKKFDGFITLHDVYNLPTLYKLIKLATEYSETPISEREEEKKYYIVLSEHFELGWQTLNYEVEKNCYIFHSKPDLKLHKTEFTDKEILEMPFNIKRAIECGFLKKVEVEN